MDLLLLHQALGVFLKTGTQVCIKPVNFAKFQKCVSFEDTCSSLSFRVSNELVDLGLDYLHHIPWICEHERERQSLRARNHQLQNETKDPILVNLAGSNKWCGHVLQTNILIAQVCKNNFGQAYMLKISKQHFAFEIHACTCVHACVFRAL